MAHRTAVRIINGNKITSGISFQVKLLIKILTITSLKQKSMTDSLIQNMNSENSDAPNDSFSDLAHSLFSSTLFNLVGWCWPAVITIITVPIILHGIGSEAYGIFGLVSILGGYFSIVSAPVTLGNERFLAEAVGRNDWNLVRRTFHLGNLIVMLLVGVASFLIFTSSQYLSDKLFNVPVNLREICAHALQIVSFTLFFNALFTAFSSILISTRRFYLLNLVMVISNTLGAAMIIVAVKFGLGLLELVQIQLLVSMATALSIIVVAISILKSLPNQGSSAESWQIIAKRILNFSWKMFFGHAASTVAHIIDRTFLSIFLSTASLAFYVVPAKITEYIPGFMYQCTRALFPISSEIVGLGHGEKLRVLYNRAQLLLLWLTGLGASVLMAVSYDLLDLWVGREFADSSWLILVILAAANLFRAPGSVAYQISNGMGRSDIYLWISLLGAVATTLPVVLLVPPFGYVGAALGVFIGMAIVNSAYDVVVRKKLFGQIGFSDVMQTYLRAATVVALSTLAGFKVPALSNQWLTLGSRVVVCSIVFVALSLLLQLVTQKDIRYVLKMLASVVRGRRSRESFIAMSPQ